MSLEEAAGATRADVPFWAVAGVGSFWAIGGSVPFALAHLRLAGAALTPFGNTIVSIEEAKSRGYGTSFGVEPLGSAPSST